MSGSTVTGSEVSYSEDKDGEEMSSVGGSGTKESIRFWTSRMPRCSSGRVTVTKRDVLDGEPKLGCDEPGAGQAMRNPRGGLRERLARGLSSAEEGRLDIRKQTGGLGNNPAPYWDM